MPRSALLTIMVNAALKAGRGLKRDFGEVSELQVSLKGPGNFVSVADHKAEKVLYDELSKGRPGYGFIGEEGGIREGDDKTQIWHVDPLDGTTNFLHGIPHFAVSIGLEREGKLFAGVVYNPATDDLFVAERGGGAFLNDRRVRVAARKYLADSVVACGIPHLGRPGYERFVSELDRVQQKVAGIRRFGAAALDLAWVAAGRIDGYWEHAIQSWDMAGGAVLVREAGGFVTGVDGGDDFLTTGHILAGNELIHGALKDALKAP
jgi:myo-inositol-1(or 4)-monophosphatase